MFYETTEAIITDGILLNLDGIWKTYIEIYDKGYSAGHYIGSFRNKGEAKAAYIAAYKQFHNKEIEFENVPCYTEHEQITRIAVKLS